MDDMIRMKNTKFAAFETEIDTLKQALSKHVKEKLLTTLNGFQTEFKERESKSIDKEIVLENKNKELENISKSLVTTSDKNSNGAIVSFQYTCKIEVSNELPKSVENADLKTQIQEKVFANAALKNELRKLKGKNVIDNVVSKPHATTIAPGMFKLDLEPLALKVLKNKDTHLEYIKHSREHAEILREIAERARALSPLDSNLDLALISSTGASGSKPTSNTKNNRISQSSSSNKTNKVEDQSRSVKSRKNKKNRVSKIKCNAYVMQSMLNANSKSVCAICNECLFDANHNKCILDYVHDVNVLFKSNLAKRKNKKQIWKPMGKVYTAIGYKWKPKGRTFTIVGNKCPLTRFTSTKVVPLKEITTKSFVTPTQGIMVYIRRPKAPKSIGSSSKSKIIEYRISNQLEPTQTGESTISNVPSSSLSIAGSPNCSVFGNTQIAKMMGYGYYQIGNVTISRVYYVEGLYDNRSDEYAYSVLFVKLIWDRMSTPTQCWLWYHGIGWLFKPNVDLMSECIDMILLHASIGEHLEESEVRKLG
ncbi:hypothetical protein Tco_0719715 [Tanacetum coccineum]